MKKFVLALFISCTWLSSCLPLQSPNPANETKQYKNVSYGTDAQQQMDVYLPANRSGDNTGVVILIHGGGWSGGDKSNFDVYNWYGNFTDNGYAVLNINYRLAQAQAFKHPAQTDDIDSAIAFLNRKSGEWNIRNDKIILLGGSAGGHLSLLFGYSRNQSGKIKGVVDMFGPTDFTDASITGNAYVNGLVINYLGAEYNTNPQLWKNASPLYHMAGAIPTIILQGGVDPLVFPIQSEMLRDSLNARHISNQYVYYPNEGHGWSGTDLNDSRDKILQWIKLYMRE